MFEKIMKEIENNLEVTRAMIDECEVLGNEDDAQYYYGYEKGLEDLKANLEELAKDEKWA